jgi:hypothetical protein
MDAETTQQGFTTMQAFGMAVLGILTAFALLTLKQFTDFAAKYIKTFLDLKQQELEESRKVNKAAEIQTAISEGVAKANQEAKNISKNPDTANLTEIDLKQIAVDHVIQTVNHEVDANILDSKIEAEVYKQSLGSLPAIKIDPSADEK